MRRAIAIVLMSCLAFGTIVLASNIHKTSNDVKPAAVPQRPSENPDYIEAKQNPHWCGTMERWEAKRQKLGLERVEAGCPMEGLCDDPITRDNTVIEPLTVRVIVHVMGDDAGYVVDQATVDATIAQMNADYAANGTDIQFSLVATRYHIDRKLACIAACTWGGCGGSITDISKIKDKYAESPETCCNIFISCQDPFYWILLGVATFPWDPDALTAQGGLWLNSIACGVGGHTATHEMGHNLGLWHTHHGVDEVVDCGDCYEFASGVECDIRGDFACDTPPTPTNYECVAPGGEDCLGTSWGPTQPENYMGYGPDDCIDLFTDQQKLRLQCWTKDALTGWIEGDQKPMWVEYINMNLQSAGANVYAVANLKVVEDEYSTGVGSVTVSGHWYGLTTDSDVFTTVSDGTGSCVSNKLKNPVGQFCFQVDNLEKSGYSWDTDRGVLSNCIGTSAKLVNGLIAGEFGITSYPNPFNPETEIHYTLPAEASVNLEIYNVIGQKVTTLVNETQNSGYHIIHWNATDIPSGVYFYRITAGEFTATNKMILMK